jgi:hypothetical protein
MRKPHLIAGVLLAVTAMPAGLWSVVAQEVYSHLAPLGRLIWPHLTRVVGGAMRGVGPQYQDVSVS